MSDDVKYYAYTNAVSTDAEKDGEAGREITYLEYLGAISAMQQGMRVAVIADDSVAVLPPLSSKYRTREERLSELNTWLSQPEFFNSDELARLDEERRVIEKDIAESERVQAAPEKAIK